MTSMEENDDYVPDLDLEAEIEAFLEDDSDTILRPAWEQELQSALDDGVYDCDILRSIIDHRSLPSDLRPIVWPSLLGVRGKHSNFKRRPGLSLIACQYSEDVELSSSVVAEYSQSRGVAPNEELAIVFEPFLSLKLDDTQAYNMFYAAMTRFHPKDINQQARDYLDLLVQYFDPEYSRKLQSQKHDLTLTAAFWIDHFFVGYLSTDTLLAFFDILFQSADGLLIFFVSLVCVLNQRDHKVNIQEIKSGDLTDLIQLANFYKSKTPASFVARMRNVFLKGKLPKDDIKSFFVLPVSPNQVVKDVLNATAGVVLDVRPDHHFEHSHLIGSLRLSCCIPDGLIETNSIRAAVTSFHRNLSSELSKDGNLDLPEIVIIGNKEPGSTMFTCANELLRVGFVGVAVVNGGFESIVTEINSIGSEDLLLWRNADNPILRIDQGSSLGYWFENPLSSHISSAFSTLNSTIEKVLTFDEDETSNF